MSRCSPIRASLAARLVRVEHAVFRQQSALYEAGHDREKRGAEHRRGAEENDKDRLDPLAPGLFGVGVGPYHAAPKRGRHFGRHDCPFPQTTRMHGALSDMVEDWLTAD